MLPFDRIHQNITFPEVHEAKVALKVTKDTRRKLSLSLPFLMCAFKKPSSRTSASDKITRDQRTGLDRFSETMGHIAS